MFSTDAGELESAYKLDGTIVSKAFVLAEWNLNDPEHIERSLCDAAVRAGATILSSDFHVFTPNNGVSGVIVLSESHISIHTWPERDFAAVDVFMCGDAQPHRTIEALREAFSPSRIGLTEHRRGLTV